MFQIFLADPVIGIVACADVGVIQQFKPSPLFSRFFWENVMQCGAMFRRYVAPYAVNRKQEECEYKS